MEFEQLWPQRRTVEIERHVEELALTDRASEELPFTVVNFIASVDGRASFGGRSVALGDEGDRALFRSLRGVVDAVLVGTGTLEAERYGRLIRDPDARERRRRRGLRAEPLACTVTRSGALPLDIPLFAEPDAEVVVFAGADVDSSGVRARLDVVRVDPGATVLRTALTRLRADYGVRALLCEGGPTLFGALARDGLFDQLFLTLSRRFVGGGDAQAIAAGPQPPEPRTLALQDVLERDGTLFLRYAALNLRFPKGRACHHC